MHSNRRWREQHLFGPGEHFVGSGVADLEETTSIWAIFGAAHSGGAMESCGSGLASGDVHGLDGCTVAAERPNGGVAGLSGRVVNAELEPPG